MNDTATANARGNEPMSTQLVSVPKRLPAPRANRAARRAAAARARATERSVTRSRAIFAAAYDVEALTGASLETIEILIAKLERRGALTADEGRALRASWGMR